MSRWHALILALLCLLTIWAYSPVRAAGLVYEDRPIQTEIRDWTPQAWPRQMGRVTDVAGVLVCGPSPACGHGVSVSVHILNGILLFLLFRRWFGADPAVFLAGVFLVHPLNTEAVAYLGGRSDILLTCFALLGLLACVEEPRWGHVALMGLACVGAMTSKEMGVIVPPLLALAYGYQHGWKPSIWSWQVVTPVLVVVALGDAWVVWHTIQHWPAPGVQHPLPGLMSMQAAALWRYVGVWLWPVGLSVDHDWALVPHTLAVAALAVLLLTGWLAWRSRWRAPTLAFGVAWIALTLAPRFVIPTEGEYLSEHQLYLPFIGLLLVAYAPVQLAHQVWSQVGREQADWVGA